jgi:hypothetical protein
MVNPADGKPLVKLSVASQDDEMAMEMAMMESAGPASGPDLGQDEIDRLMA